jgi:hypothetical protein
VYKTKLRKSEKTISKLCKKLGELEKDRVELKASSCGKYSDVRRGQAYRGAGFDAMD